MHDDGEPISRGQIDRRAADAAALRNALLVVALVGSVVLVNGVLAILLIELLQVIGVWPTEAMMTEVPSRMPGPRAASAT